MKTLSDDLLILETFKAAKNEKAATIVLLEYLIEMEERKLFVSLGHLSLFDYINKGLKYSESQTSERIAAMRLLREVPEIKSHLEDGSLNLTNAAQIQRFAHKEKKNPETVISECLNHSKREVEQILYSKSSDQTKAKLKEKTKFINDEEIEVRFRMKEEKLKRAKELVRTDSLSDLFTEALQALIEKKEKQLGKIPTPPAEEIEPKSSNTRYIPKSIKQKLHQISNGECEHIDPKTKQRCHSKHHIEVDHIHPFSKGGQTEFENLRHLCRAHNQYAAKKAGIKIPKSASAPSRL